MRSKPVLVTAFLAILGVSLGAVLLFARTLDDRPSREHVSQHLVLGGQLLAYQIWDGEPHVVFRSPDGNAVRLDHLRRDWISIEFPPVPAWQLSGDWYTLRPSDDPASVGVVQHGPTELFGLIHSGEIARMEVEYGGRWHSFDVEAPAYLIQLPGFDGIPSGYRWLDEHGNVIWSEETIPALRN